jgi:hypothetical protein
MPLTILLLIQYGLIEAKVIEVHLPSSEEGKLLDDYDKNRQNEKDEETLNDPDASIEDKADAANRLTDNGVIS